MHTTKPNFSTTTHSVANFLFNLHTMTVDCVWTSYLQLYLEVLHVSIYPFQ